MGFEDDDGYREPVAPEGMTREDFMRFRAPKYGTKNPERMNNPVWEWLVHSRLNAFQAGELFQGPDPFDAGPGWCFDRFGQSETVLPDGRKILIAGEHEDHYDPDFYIYNDLVVIKPDGAMDIYGYPAEAFPPTDFHSATLTDTHIILIGNLGYPDRRRHGETQVMQVTRDDWEVSVIDSSGDNPGWLHEHSAELTDDGAAILVTGGRVDMNGETSLVENIDDWKLYLDDWRWERLTRRDWPRFEAHRADKQPDHLWEYRMVAFSKEMGWQQYKQELEDLADKIGAKPSLDVYAEVFTPPVEHEKLPDEEDSYHVSRIRIEGVIVRYVRNSRCVQVTVEGALPPATVDLLRIDLRKKLQKLENTEITCFDIEGL